MPYYIKHTPDYFHYTVGLMTLPVMGRRACWLIHNYFSMNLTSSVFYDRISVVKFKVLI